MMGLLSNKVIVDLGQDLRLAVQSNAIVQVRLAVLVTAEDHYPALLRHTISEDGLILDPVRLLVHAPVVDRDLAHTHVRALVPVPIRVVEVALNLQIVAMEAGRVEIGMFVKEKVVGVMKQIGVSLLVLQRLVASA